MPIVNHIIDATVQPNGSQSYVLRMYDQEANEYLQTGFAPPNFDLQSLVTTKIAEMDQALAEQEFNSLIGG